MVFSLLYSELSSLGCLMLLQLFEEILSDKQDLKPDATVVAFDKPQKPASALAPKGVLLNSASPCLAEIDGLR